MNALDKSVITFDTGIPLPPLEGPMYRPSMHEIHRDKLLIMKVLDDSFFFEGKVRDDIAGLIRYATRMGVHLAARTTDEDEIYMVPGVRVWRVENPGDKPDTKIPKGTRSTKGKCATCSGKGEVGGANATGGWDSEPCPDCAKQWWYHDTSESYSEMTVKEAEAANDGNLSLIGNGKAKLAHETKNSQPAIEWAKDATKKRALSREEDDKVMAADPESIKYYRHTSSGVTYRTSQVAASSNKDVVEITKACWESGIDYSDAHHVYLGTAGETWWRCGDGRIVCKMAGVAMPDGPYDMVDKAQFIAQEAADSFTMIGKAEETWWRKENDVCVEVSAKKFAVAMRTPGAVRISKEAYLEYLASLPEDDDL